MGAKCEEVLDLAKIASEKKKGEKKMAWTTMPSGDRTLGYSTIRSFADS